MAKINFQNQGYIFHIMFVPCHHSTACPLYPVEEMASRVAVNVLNMLSEIVVKG
jgi:hypothetical protein